MKLQFYTIFAFTFTIGYLVAGNQGSTTGIDSGALCHQACASMSSTECFECLPKNNGNKYKAQSGGSEKDGPRCADKMKSPKVVNHITGKLTCIYVFTDANGAAHAINACGAGTDIGDCNMRTSQTPENEES